MDDIKLIQLKPDEWRAYKQLRLEALKSDPESFGNTYENSIGQLEDYWRDSLKANKGIKVFASLNGELVGMAGAYYENEGGRINACIIAVYTSPPHRGKGISEKILRELIDKIKFEEKANTIVLHVNKDAKAAIGLYKKLGFVAGAAIEDYVRPDGKTFPQYLMSLHLS